MIVMIVMIVMMAMTIDGLARKLRARDLRSSKIVKLVQLKKSI